MRRSRIELANGPKQPHINRARRRIQIIPSPIIRAHNIPRIAYINSADIQDWATDGSNSRASRKHEIERAAPGPGGNVGEADGLVEAVDAAGVLGDDEGAVGEGGVGEGRGRVGFGEDLEDVGSYGCAGTAGFDRGGGCGGEEGEGEEGRQEYGVMHCGDVRAW